MDRIINQPRRPRAPFHGAMLVTLSGRSSKSDRSRHANITMRMGKFDIGRHLKSDLFTHSNCGLGQTAFSFFYAPSLALHNPCHVDSQNQSHALLGMHSEVRMRCLAAKPRDGGVVCGGSLDCWSGGDGLAWPGLPGLLRAFRAHPA